MLFYEKIQRAVLLDLLSLHTRQFIKILLNGEKYRDEYTSCKESLGMTQRQFLWLEKLSVQNQSYLDYSDYTCKSA